MNFLKNHRKMKLLLGAVSLILVPVFLSNGVFSAVTPIPGASNEGITYSSNLRSPFPRPPSPPVAFTHPGLAYVWTKDGVNVIDIRYGTVKALWAGIPRSSWPDNVDKEAQTIIWAQIGKPPLDVDGKYRGMYALDSRTMTILTKVITNSKSGNWVVEGINSRWVYGAARTPANEYIQVGADPIQADFGLVVDMVTIPGTNIDPSKSVPGPCDAAITSDNLHIWEPDIWGDTLTRINLADAPGGFDVGLQYPMVELVSGVRVFPFMTTVSVGAFADQYVLVENLEGGDGTESVFDISDPDNPLEVVRFVQDSRLAALAIAYPGLVFTGSNSETVTIKGGLGQKPRSDEFTKDGLYSLLINSKSNDVNIVNMATLTIDCTVAFPAHPTGETYKADTGDWSVDGKQFLVNLEDTDEVGVIAYDDSASTCATKFTYLTTITGLGDAPQGIVVRKISYRGYR